MVSESSRDVDVLIVGAGPTGLVLALCLSKLGVTVRIVDKAAEPGTTSRALAVQTRTLEFYRQLGLSDAVVAAGVKIEAANLWVGGANVARVELSRMGEGASPFPFALIYAQDAHERLLIERLEVLGVRVERPVELLRFAQDPHGVRAVLAGPDGAEETCEAAYLAGCDGASSSVRETLSIGFPGGTYAGSFYVADVDASGPAADGDIHVDLEQAELSFDSVGKRAIGNLKLAIGKVNWFSTYRVHHRVATRFCEGRVFLLGDAAHVHSPVGGQGMNTGIGDAINLAWKLAAVINGGAAMSLLDSYEPERIRFARRLVATTDRVFTFVSRPGALARWVRTKAFPAVAPRAFRLPAVRRFLFRTVSQTGIEYRRSPLSVGAAGSVRGGDRLPWVPLGPESDNFAPLSSLRWQVHVYGEASRGLAKMCATLQIPFHRFDWRPDMRQAGFLPGALYLIRPDGYVALADALPEPGVLRGYFTERGITGYESGPDDGAEASSCATTTGSTGFTR